MHLLGYSGNTNYRILLEDWRIVGTPNAEFYEALMTPSTQTVQDVGAKRYGSPGATAAAAGGSETVGPLNQPSASIRQASVAASGRHASVVAPEQILPETSHGDLQILPRTSTKDSQSITPSDHMSNLCDDLTPLATSGAAVRAWQRTELRDCSMEALPKSMIFALGMEPGPNA